MRTPGHDIEMACGWLINEFDVFEPGDIATVKEFPGRADEAESVAKEL